MLNIIVSKIRIASVLERAVLESKHYIVLYNADKDRYDMFVKSDERNPAHVAKGTLDEITTIFDQHTSVAAVKDEKYKIVDQLKENGFYTEYVGDGHFIANNDSIDVEVYEYADEHTHCVKIRVAPRGHYWQLTEVATVADLLKYSASTKQLEMAL